MHSIEVLVCQLKPPLPAGEVLRIHKVPRRYRDGCWTGAEEWRRRVIHLDDELFVLNKPSRLPTQRHESNAVECVGGRGPNTSPSIFSPT